ncbi:MAG TPA: hypothetical protein VFH49_09460 [Aquabacterium sp.]|nr:hypothetical protein [Aquabacterium sp.]
MLDDDKQNLVVNTICHFAEMTHAANSSAAAQHESAAIEAQRPSVLFRPSLSVDGNQWCALYGDNLQDGVAGFGDSPEAAMAGFDKAWRTPLSKPASAALDNMMGRSEWPAFVTAQGAQGVEGK